MEWIDRKKQEPEEPFMAMGYSNHLLAYSKKEDCWFEAVYDFKKKTFCTLDHFDLEQYNISHFCENVPTP